MTYDQKSYDLAEYFLADVQNIDHYRMETLTRALAERIQQTIEDFLAAEKLD